MAYPCLLDNTAKTFFNKNDPGNETALPGPKGSLSILQVSRLARMTERMSPLPEVSCQEHGADPEDRDSSTVPRVIFLPFQPKALIFQGAFVFSRASWPPHFHRDLPEPLRAMRCELPRSCSLVVC